MSQYWTINSNIRPHWKADILQTAITHQSAWGKRRHSLLLCFSRLVIFFFCCCFDFWMFSDPVARSVCMCWTEQQLVWGHFRVSPGRTHTWVCTWFAKICMFDLNFCSRYIIEYISPAFLLFFFFLFWKQKWTLQSFDCSNWSSGTLYTCVVSIRALMVGSVAVFFVVILSVGHWDVATPAVT